MEIGVEKIADSLSESSKSYDLSALIYADSLFYGLFDYGYKLQKSGVLHDISHSKSEILKNTRALIRRSKLAIADPNFILLPAGFYTSEHIDYLLKDENPSKGNTHLYRTDIVENFNIRVGYAVSKKEVQRLNESFDSPILTHFISGFLGNIDNNEAMLPYQIHSCAYGNFQTIALTKGSQLIWANHYDCHSAESYVYYFGVICKVHNIETHKVEVKLSGWVDEDHNYVKLLKRYFKHISFVRSEISFDGQVIDNVQYHHPLISIAKCA